MQEQLAAQARLRAHVHSIHNTSRDLDGRRLRELPDDEALERLRELPGIGRFSAALVLVRGAGAPDVFPESEPRFLAAMARAHGVEGGDVPALERIAARWSPYRSWVALLFRASVAP